MDLIILLNMDMKTEIIRNRNVNKSDRLELEDVEFHKRVRNGYLKIASKEKKRIKIVDASESMEQVQNKILNIITDFLKNR